MLATNNEETPITKETPSKSIRENNADTKPRIRSNFKMSNAMPIFCLFLVEAGDNTQRIPKLRRQKFRPIKTPPNTSAVGSNTRMAWEIITSTKSKSVCQASTRTRYDVERLGVTFFPRKVTQPLEQARKSTDQRHESEERGQPW